MRAVLLSCFLCVALYGNQANSQRTYNVPPSFLTAKGFVAITDDERVNYTTGLMDGFYGAEMFQANAQEVDRLAACTKPMDSKQITAIIAKYIQEHPEGWHLPASVEAYNALNGACPGRINEKTK